MKKMIDINKHSDLNSYYWFEEYFSPEEIEDIKKISEKYKKIGAVAGREDGKKAVGVRSSSIKWIGPSKETYWIYEKMCKAINTANNELWNFDWEGQTDEIQYTEYYDIEGGKYDWHIDVGNGTMSMRKISAVVLLNDGYEGGELQLKSIGENLDMKKGNMFIFPSFVSHRVTPVTKGTRKSLVMWAGGPQPLR
tara:strand:+ start:1517 stop:2098 length:582 start_codon:yes stop_codon:yes gene_type:complete